MLARLGVSPVYLALLVGVVAGSFAAIPILGEVPNATSVGDGILIIASISLAVRQAAPRP